MIQTDRISPYTNSRDRRRIKRPNNNNNNYMIERERESGGCCQFSNFERRVKKQKDKAEERVINKKMKGWKRGEGGGVNLRCKRRERRKWR